MRGRARRGGGCVKAGTERETETERQREIE